MWTLAFGYHRDRAPTHGYAASHCCLETGLGVKRATKGAILSERGVSAISVLWNPMRPAIEAAFDRGVVITSHRISTEQ
jgi:hypothetical protein